jgi:hypothetical protein
MQAALRCFMCAMLSCMALCIAGLAPARAECALGKTDAPRGVATLYVMDRRGPCHGKGGGVAKENMMNVLLTNRERDTPDIVAVVFVVPEPETARVQVYGSGCATPTNYKYPRVALAPGMYAMSCHATWVTSTGLTLDADISVRGPGEALVVSNQILRGGPFGD